jgi:transposase
VGASERDEFLRAAWRALSWPEGSRAQALCIRRRVLDQHLPYAAVCVVEARGAGTLLYSAQLWGANVTLLSSMGLRGIGPSLAVAGPTTREVFEAYLEQVLGPALREGQVMVMDNLSSHKRSRVRALIEQRGCELLYLPPYSPDFNPIEEAFSKIKGLLRKAEARSREALIEAMGRAISAVTPQDVRGFFEHRG